MNTHEDCNGDVFHRLGYLNVQPLAAGMEGRVYRLEGGVVGKIWSHRTVSVLNQLRQFYSDIAAFGPPFQTPEIHRIVEVGGSLVTIERELPGTQLDHQVSAADRTISERVLASMLDTLDGLANIPVSASMRNMAVLGEQRSLWMDCETWRQALRTLVERRVELFGSHLRRHVTNFDTTFVAALRLLESTEDVPVRLIHGDLVPANILADTSLTPIAVLDFGFLSTCGDPAFDAAIAACTFNMYGPYAREIEATIDAAIVVRFGYQPEKLTLYKALYAMATSNIYDPNGKDGHFSWCISVLQREDVAAVLGP